MSAEIPDISGLRNFPDAQKWLWHFMVFCICYVRGQCFRVYSSPNATIHHMRSTVSSYFLVKDRQRCSALRSTLLWRSQQAALDEPSSSHVNYRWKVKWNFNFRFPTVTKQATQAKRMDQMTSKVKKKTWHAEFDEVWPGIHAGILARGDLTSTAACNTVLLCCIHVLINAQALAVFTPSKWQVISWSTKTESTSG
jgi:hypothetical protein